MRAARTSVTMITETLILTEIKCVIQAQNFRCTRNFRDQIMLATAACWCHRSQYGP